MKFIPVNSKNFQEILNQFHGNPIEIPWKSHRNPGKFHQRTKVSTAPRDLVTPLDLGQGSETLRDLGEERFEWDLDGNSMDFRDFLVIFLGFSGDFRGNFLGFSSDFRGNFLGFSRNFRGKCSWNFLGIS